MRFFVRWVIGDIHGMLRPLQALLGRVNERDPAAQLLFVGDYINRGPDSRGVLDLLISLPNARFARGNHDDIFDMVLNGRSYAPHPQAGDPLSAFMWFTHYGMIQTLDSYGVDWLEVEWVRHHPTEAGVRKLFSVVPEAHREFIRSLGPVIEEPDLFVAHAMWDPDEPDDVPTIAQRLSSDPQLRFRVLWGRYGGEVGRVKRWRRTGYFGHTPVEVFPPALTGGRNEPIRGPAAPGMVLLDTGAALSLKGRLTAVCADTGEVIQVDRSGAAVEGERGE